MGRRLAFVMVSVLLVTAVVVVASGAAPDAPRSVYKLMGVLGQVVSLVRSSYVDEVPVDRIELGATTGLVEAADAGGAWVPDEYAGAFEAAHTRPLPPFGLVLGKRSSYPFVLQVIDGSPAALAGLVPGQLVERIGGEPVRARPLWRALVMLDQAERGAGAVELNVVDARLEGERRLRLERAVYAVPGPTVVPHDDVPVLRVGVLSAAAVATVEEVLRPWGAAQSVVVDLRGTALGSPADAVKLAAALAGGAVELQAQRRGSQGGMVRARAPERTWRLVACVDPTTGKAAEVLALALRSRGAVLVGGETYGDTATRRPIASEGGRVWLAEEWFATPDGTAILGQGLKPDEVVRGRGETDPVLLRALEIARGARPAKAA